MISILIGLLGENRSWLKLRGEIFEIAAEATRRRELVSPRLPFAAPGRVTGLRALFWLCYWIDYFSTAGSEWWR